MLLTPLYVRIAVRRGLDPVRLGFQPVDVMARHAHRSRQGSTPGVGVRVGLPALIVGGAVAINLGCLF